jgi:DNA-binding SARP family transcriptional activator/DNA-binding beta-propeller fold protein YncE
VEFRILGPLQVLDGDAAVALGSPKERALLAVLLLHARAVVSRERLIDELWGESPPPTAAKALNVHVSQLRKSLARNGHETIATRPPGYTIEVEPDRLDAARFERLVATARERIAAGDIRAASSLLRDSLALWRGPALDGVELEAAARNEVAGLDELRLAAQMDRIDCDLALGLHEQLMTELEALVAEHPLRERLRGQLMLALYRSGRQADALRAYREARETLVGELGIEPSITLQRLEKAILNQDPSLEAPARIARADSGPEPVEDHRSAAAVAASPSSSGRAGAEAARRIVPTKLRGRRLVLASVALVFALALASVAVLVTRRGSAVLPAIAPDSIAIVDPLRNAVVADIALHTRPAAIAYGAGSLWVATKDDQTLLQIDPRTHRITRTIGLGVEPAAIATGDRYVWVLGGNTLLEFDGHTATLVRKMSLGGTIRVGPSKGRPLPQVGLVTGTAPNLDLAAGAGAAWIGYGDDVVARVDAKTGAVGQIAAGSSFGIAFGGGAAWSVSGPFVGPAFGTISRIDARTRTVTEIPPANVGADSQIYGIAAGPHGVWAISQNNKRALKIDPDIGRVTAVIPLDHPPADVAVGAGAVWFANTDSTLSRIDNSTAAVVKTIPLGRYPRAAYPVDLAAGERVVWVALH